MRVQSEILVGSSYSRVWQVDQGSCDHGLPFLGSCCGEGVEFNFLKMRMTFGSWEEMRIDCRQSSWHMMHSLRRIPLLLVVYQIKRQSHQKQSRKLIGVA